MINRKTAGLQWQSATYLAIAQLEVDKGKLTTV